MLKHVDKLSVKLMLRGDWWREVSNDSQLLLCLMVSTAIRRCQWEKCGRDSKWCRARISTRSKIWAMWMITLSRRRIFQLGFRSQKSFNSFVRSSDNSWGLSPMKMSSTLMKCAFRKCVRIINSQLRSTSSISVTSNPLWQSGSLKSLQACYQFSMKWLLTSLPRSTLITAKFIQLSSLEFVICQLKTN